MKSRIALFCAAAFGALVLMGCAPKATTKYDVAYNAQDAKKYDVAVDNYNQFIAANKDSTLVPYAMYNVAYCYRQQMDQAKAMEAYQKLVDQYPSSTPAEWAKLDMEQLKKNPLVKPTTTTTAPKAKPTTTTTTVKATTTTLKAVTSTTVAAPTTTTVKPTTTTTAVPK